jgi:hypothetical protein
VHTDGLRQMAREMTHTPFPWETHTDPAAESTAWWRPPHSLVNAGKTVPLLCYERNPEQCHRKVVAEQIKKLDGNGLKVEHIVPI